MTKERQEMADKFKQALIDRNLPFVEINHDTWLQRENAAIIAINKRM
jgi:nicotinamide riboside kinase